MFRQTITAAATFALLSLTPALAQDATDYLGVPGPLTVGDTTYALSWSSNPSEGYYKQEYLPKGAVPETYDSMVMVEFLATDRPLAEVVAAQTAMVEERKATDPVANVAVLQNETTGEIVVDFLVSAKDENGEFIIEWNGYRYVEAEYNNQPGAMLFAISERAYGNEEAENFLKGLRDFKADRIVELTNADLPDLN